MLVRRAAGCAPATRGEVRAPAAYGAGHGRSRTRIYLMFTNKLRRSRGLRGGIATEDQRVFASHGNSPCPSAGVSARLQAGTEIATSQEYAVSVCNGLEDVGSTTEHVVDTADLHLFLVRGPAVARSPFDHRPRTCGIEICVLIGQRGRQRRWPAACCSDACWATSSNEPAESSG